MLRDDVPERRARRSRPGAARMRITAGIRFGLIAAASLSAAACERPAPAPPPPEPQAQAPAEPLTVPIPTALDRAQLIRAAAEAASAFAATGEAGQADLVGRAFAIRLPFGCQGPVQAPEQADGLARATLRRDGGVRLTLTPAEWKDAPFLAAAWSEEGPHSESVEGLWVPQPWLLTETCPQTAATEADGASPQTLGLAAVFTAEQSRMGRRNGRAYTHAVSPEPAGAPAAPPAWYRVLVEGRIAAFPNGKPVVCHASGPAQRPVCVVAFRPDRLAFEDGRTSAVLSEWRAG